VYIVFGVMRVDDYVRTADYIGSELYWKAGFTISDTLILAYYKHSSREYIEQIQRNRTNVIT
jgi:hypothetical protein